MQREFLKIILDTDIGDDIDDAFALDYLLSLSGVELLGVTTVYKNVAERARIAKRFLRLKGKDTKVFAGENDPLEKRVRLLYGETVREDGLIKIDHYTADLDGEEYESEDAVSFILRSLKAHPHEITLVAIGPLTNLARCAQKDLETFRLAKELLVMGGRFESPIPEWNLETDPQGAKIVFASGVPCRLVPFDATVLTTLTREGVERVRRAKGKAKEYLARMMNRWIEHYDDNWKGEKIPILHDVLALMVLEEEEAFEKRVVQFSLPTEGEFKDCTVEEKDGEYSCVLYDKFDKEKFYRNFWERWER